ncbi:MAG: CHRD domain-containing protein [Gemmatimonadales bacterium]
MNYLKMTVVALALMACGGGSSTGGLDVEQSYLVSLSPANEVPAPKPTTASGTAQVVVFADRIDYQLAVTSITAITMAHIHSGAVGVAGPIVVTLYQTTPPTGAVNGVFASGSLTAATLPAGVTLASLKTLLLTGNSYINVHTTANPAGEIRGQLK